jgi:ABC-type polysaccharide/polyol phosphate export permease
MSSFVELFAYREVFLALVWRELKSRYRGSILGYLWTLLHPLLLMTIYSLVFAVYMRIDIPKYPVFVFSGLLPWMWFSSAMLASTTSIIEGGGLIKRTAFPPQILPAVAVTSTLVNFLLALPLLLAFVIGWGLRVSWALLMLPVLILIQYLLTLGLALPLSMVTVRYRDLQHLIASLMTLWFFVTPILYPVSFVPASLRAFVWLNPLAPLMTAFQETLYQGRLPALRELAVVAAVAIAVFMLAVRFCAQRRWRVVEEV